MPRCAVSAYLDAVYAEAVLRGYRFDRSKIGPVRAIEPIVVTRGQLAYEWDHLLRKLALRSPAHYRQWRSVRTPECHPLFRRRPGPVEHWERGAR